MKFLWPILALAFWNTTALALEFALPTDDAGVSVTGQVDLPKGVECLPGGVRYPAIVMVPGSGAFDRDVVFGNSKSPKDALFKILSQEITAKEVMTVRFDYRGVGPKGVQLDVRKRVTPETTRDDIVRVFEHAKRIPCVDPERVAVFAHSEGSIHVSRLVGSGRILPNSLVFLGMVATSAKSIVHWQAVGRQVEKGADRSELERAYEKHRAEQLAIADTEMKSGFWNYRYWKTWWTDDKPVAEELRNYPYGIYAHFADGDSSTPGPIEMAAFRKASQDLKIPPKVVMHPGRGHSLGMDPLVGPMVESDLKQLVDDLVIAARAEPESTIDWAKVPYMGVLFAPTDPFPDVVREKHGLRSRYGLRLDRALPALPAWKAGLRAGDIILAMNGEEVGLLPKADAAARLSRRVRALKPGTVATLRVLRWKTDAQATREMERVDPPRVDGHGAVEAVGKFVAESKPESRYALNWSRKSEAVDVDVQIVIPEPARPPLRPVALSASDKELEKFAVRVHEHYGKSSDLTDLIKRFKDRTVRPDPFRLPVVDALQQQPFALRSVVTRLTDQVRAGGLRGILSVAIEESRTADVAGAAPAVLKTGLKPSEHVARLRALLEEAQADWTQAFSGLTVEEQTKLRGGLAPLAHKFLEWNYVYSDPDLDRLNENLKLIDLAAKVNLAPLLRSTESLLRIAHRDFARALKRDLSKAGLKLDSSVVLEEKTPFGKIRIAGTGSDEHRNLAGDEVAILIDLGGDDLYNNAAAVSGEKVKAALVVDLEGNDAYESAWDFSFGVGILGVGILADLAGQDRYVSTRIGQGVGMAGVGVLIDSTGDDEYRAQQLAQGAGFFGTGILWDGSGDDRYEARSHAQAISVGGGSAFLFDAKGNDLYFSKGLTPSGYGTPGTYEGWSQGIGVGLRFLASGGLAILHDGGGKDRMESGDFGQGAGYYFGMGIVDARGREGDTYVGNRYAQGTSAHTGIGAFLEEGGADFYDTRGAVAVGNSNDGSLTWFRDGAGDDRYPGQHFCTGASANNSLSIFEDGAGRDRWVGEVPISSGQDNDYWGGKSLSLVFLSKHATCGEKACPEIEARGANSFIFREGGEKASSSADFKRLPPFSEK